jgi:hypothetical protein
MVFLSMVVYHAVFRRVPDRAPRRAEAVILHCFTRWQQAGRRVV